MLVLVCMCILRVVYAHPRTYAYPLCFLIVCLLVYRFLYSVSIAVYTHFYTPINSVVPIQFYPYFTPILTK